MTNEEFWNGDPRLARSYREAHEMRNIQKNQEMWVQGLYNFKAFRSVIEGFAYGLNQCKGTKPSPYPSDPIPLTKTEQDAATERNKQRTLDWVQSGQH